MKVYLIYDEGYARSALTPLPPDNARALACAIRSPSDGHHKLAITLPTKWLDQSADKVKELFVERYNKKFPDTPLDDEELVLAVKDDSPFTNRDVKHLTSSDTPGSCFVAGMEVRIVPPPKQVKPGMTASGKLRCKNFGCQMEYDEATNCDGSCRHHVEPPVFHDTRKWWSCCEGALTRAAASTARIPRTHARACATQRTGRVLSSLTRV